VRGGAALPIPARQLTPQARSEETDLPGRLPAPGVRAHLAAPCLAAAIHRIPRKGTVLLVKVIAAAAVMLCLSTFPVAAEPAAGGSQKQESAAPSARPAGDRGAPRSTPPAPELADEEEPELVVHLGIPADQKEAKPTDGVGEPAEPAAAAPPPKPAHQPSPKEKAVAQRKAQLAREGLAFRGTPYVWGGDGRSGFDCSGLTQYLYARLGIKLPHSAKMQYALGIPVARQDLQIGDLVFFNIRGPLTHVGMYIGDGKFVHAANPRKGVTVTRLDSPFYSRRYAGARRYG